jgi:hypothetical protein
MSANASEARVSKMVLAMDRLRVPVSHAELRSGSWKEAEHGSR